MHAMLEHLISARSGTFGYAAMLDGAIIARGETRADITFDPDTPATILPMSKTLSDDPEQTTGIDEDGVLWSPDELRPSEVISESVNTMRIPEPATPWSDEYRECVAAMARHMLRHPSTSSVGISTNGDIVWAQNDSRPARTLSPYRATAAAELRDNIQWDTLANRIRTSAEKRRADLAWLAETVWGHGWQTRLAETVDVAGRSVRRWVSGDSAVPDDVLSLVAGMAEAKIRLKIEAATADLRRAQSLK